MVQGVTEHAFFLKELHHARAIRQRLLENIELAVEHNSTEMMAQLCHCVVVGGGPTGTRRGNFYKKFHPCTTRTAQ